MGATNKTTNLELPQFIGTDKPSWLGDFNGAMNTIDVFAGTTTGSIGSVTATANAAKSTADSAAADVAALGTTVAQHTTEISGVMGDISGLEADVTQINTKLNDLTSVKYSEVDATIYYNGWSSTRHCPVGLIKIGGKAIITISPYTARFTSPSNAAGAYMPTLRIQGNILNINAKTLTQGLNQNVTMLEGSQAVIFNLSTNTIKLANYPGTCVYNSNDNCTYICADTLPGSSMLIAETYNLYIFNPTRIIQGNIYLF